MAQDSRHGQRTHRLIDQPRFPPTVVGHDEYKNGTELQLLDSGAEEEPRFIWIPDADDEESVFAL